MPDQSWQAGEDAGNTTNGFSSRDIEQLARISGSDYQSTWRFIKQLSPNESARLRDAWSKASETNIWGNKDDALWKPFLQQLGDRISQVGDPKNNPDQTELDKNRADREAFARELMSPDFINSAAGKAIISRVQGNAGLDAYRRAGPGGMSDAVVANAGINAGNQAYLQRAGMGAQVLAGTYGDKINTMNLQNQADANTANINYQNQLAQYESQRGQNQGIGGFLGGLAGAIPGILTGNPGLISAGVGAGSQFGSGLGGMASGGPPGMSAPRNRFGTGGMSGRGGY